MDSMSGWTSVLCLLFRPKTVHCSTKNVYTSEITFLALVPCLNLLFLFLNFLNSSRSNSQRNIKGLHYQAANILEIKQLECETSK